MTINTVLVTGGSGFIGSYVVDRLLSDGIEVVSFDHTHGPGNLPTGATRYLGDIRNAEAVTEAMAHVDGFVHLAGVLGTQETISNPKPAIMTNIEGGLNVLEAAAQYGVPGVNIAVGNHWEQNPYSISKSTVERMCRMFNAYRGTNVSVVRALNAYGPRQSVAEPYGRSKVRKIIPSFVMRALHGDPIEVYGDGSQIMDMVHVRDVANFLVDALVVTDEDGEISTTIEAGTGLDTTVRQIAEAVIEEVGQGEISYLPLRPGETPGAVVKADVSTHRSLYSHPYEFQTLPNGLAETVAFYRRKTGKF
jgi:UDP-glucose 4-epimerase